MSFMSITTRPAQRLRDQPNAFDFWPVKIHLEARQYPSGDEQVPADERQRKELASSGASVRNWAALSLTTLGNCSWGERTHRRGKIGPPAKTTRDAVKTIEQGKQKPAFSPEATQKPDMCSVEKVARAGVNRLRALMKKQGLRVVDLKPCWLRVAELATEEAKE
jgi:hypothetical protein